MALYHDPKFRRMMARGIYQGIVKFFQSENGGPRTLLPEPPRNFRAKALDSTSVQLIWTAPLVGPAGGRGDAATAYKVYRSTHGRGFPPGTAVANGTTTTINGLDPGTTYYFYVTAINGGGESFATETLAVRTAAIPGAPHLLLVNGFDKMDIATVVHTNVGANVVYRQFLDQMNGMDHIVEHARAIEIWEGGASFDSVSRSAVDANLIDLTPYDAVIWMGGLQAEVSTADPVDDTALKLISRNALAGYLNNGGRLFMSGASLAKDLNRISQSSYMNNNLKIGLVGTTSAGNAILGLSGTIFEGMNTAALLRQSDTRYIIRESDTLAPVQGGVTALHYGTAPGSSIIHDFEAAAGWQQPGYSSQTNADGSSSFSIVSSPVKSGTGSGRLNYVWGTGNFIRLYNSSLPSFPAESDFSIWVYGDNSGHQVRICLRDPENDLFVTDWLTINFSGWQKINWPNVLTNPQNTWFGSGNMNGPNVRLDSIQVQKISGVNSGSLYFDEAVYTTTGLGQSEWTDGRNPVRREL